MGSVVGASSKRSLTGLIFWIRRPGMGFRDQLSGQRVTRRGRFWLQGQSGINGIDQHGIATGNRYMGHVTGAHSNGGCKSRGGGLASINMTRATVIPRRIWQSLWRSTAEGFDVSLATLIQMSCRPEIETADHQVARLLTTFRSIRTPAARTEFCRRYTEPRYK